MYFAEEGELTNGENIFTTVKPVKAMVKTARGRKSTFTNGKVSKKRKDLKVDPQEFRHFKEMAINFLNKHNLESSNSSGYNLGTQVKSKNTMLAYKTHLNALRSFCLLKGDHESLAILLDEAPIECPSMSHETIYEYIKYRTLPPGTTVVGIANSPVIDKDGNAIVSIGGWSAPINAKQCASAITALHLARRQTGKYKDSCSLCLTEFSNPMSMGCSNHRMNPRYKREGNPRLDVDIVNCLNWARHQLADHVVQGRQALLPYELEKVRLYLISTNTIWGLQLWAMINIQIHLGDCSFNSGLREDDLINLKFEKIFLNLSTIRNNQIDSLFIEFKGKTERRTGVSARLMLWADQENTTLCPIRSLLAYVYLSKLKTGFVFPQVHLLDEISDGDANDERFKMKSTFANDCTKVYETVTGNVGVYGTHTGKKTYYLLGVLGGGEVMSLKQGARHQQDSTVETYLQDAQTIKEILIAQDRLHEAPVSKFRPIFCQTETNIARLQRSNNSRSVTVYGLARIFVEEFCNIQREDITSIDDFMESIYNFNRRNTAEEELLNLIPASERERAVVLMNRVVTDKVSRRRHIASLNQTSEITPPSAPIVAALVCDQSSSPNQVDIAASINEIVEEEEEENLSSRKQLKSLKSIRAKVEFLLSFQVPTNSKLTEGARCWVRDCLKPTLNCVNNHFSGDVDLFVEHWEKEKKFAISTFKKSCPSKCKDQVIEPQ